MRSLKSLFRRRNPEHPAVTIDDLPEGNLNVTVEQLEPRVAPGLSVTPPGLGGEEAVNVENFPSEAVAGAPGLVNNPAVSTGDGGGDARF